LFQSWAADAELENTMQSRMTLKAIINGRLGRLDRFDIFRKNMNNS
jgi:hypothetical protein